jgi:hypothetical protein
MVTPFSGVNYYNFQPDNLTYILVGATGEWGVTGQPRGRAQGPGPPGGHACAHIRLELLLGWI